MKKKIFIILLSFMILPSIISASSGALKTKTIKMCPDGYYYGSHGDGHWHRAVYQGKYYYPDGDAISSDPCKKVRVTFNANGGYVSKTSKNVYTHYTYGKLPIPTRKGYTFDGWYTKKTDGKNILSSTKVSAKVYTLYAHWTKIKYKITYELNGGVNNKDNPAKYKVTSIIKLKNPTRKGYIFKGWYKDSEFKKEIKTIKKGTTGNKTFYAKWKAIKYVIKFDKNGGTGTMKNTPSIKYTTSYVLPTNKFKRKGYEFIGWNTKKDGTGKSFENKGTVLKLTSKNNKIVTLYARWSKIKYDINYYLDNGINNEGNPSYYKITDNIVLKNPTKEGYTFKGWYKDSELKTKGNTIEKGSTGKKNFYAKWKIINYDIIYNLDGGVNNSDNVFTYTVEDEINLYEPTKEGYSFYGWYSDENFENKVLKIEKGTTNNLTLYAKWGDIGYNITYELDGGTNNLNNVDHFIDDEVTLYPASKKGYEFAGWYSDENFENEITKIDEGTSEDITVYAKWNIINYDIIYNLDDGVNNSDNVFTYTIEDEINLYEPTKEGYSFYGWYSDENFENEIEKIEAGTTENITLYAKWGDIRYSITYVLDGGINNENNVINFKADEEIVLFDPTKNGYDFDGWYDNEEFTNKITKIDEGTSEDITVYAKWNIKNYTIDYHLNGGVNNVDNPKTYTVEDNITLLAPTRSGFDFDCWRLNGGMGEKITEITPGTTGTVHLYAYWNPRVYHIYYVLNGGTNDANNPDTFRSDESVFLHTPMRTGYLFSGWYLDPEFTQRITDIPYGTDHDVTVYIRWNSADSHDDAIDKAQEYLNERAYSYDMLLMALEDWERFTEETAIYALENCGANWNQQAARRAQELEKRTPYSSVKLIQVLVEYELFTEEQANYAIENAEIDWLSVAQRCAFNAVQDNTYTYDELVAYMISEGFSEELAIQGANFALN